MNSPAEIEELRSVQNNGDIDEDEERDEVEQYVEEKDHEAAKKSKIFWITLLIVFLVALAPRLITIFFLTDPHNPGSNWAGDVFHRWQISYLTWKIGIGEGLRAWDLKGLDYFWGTGFTFMSVLIAMITGLHDVIVSRVLTSIFGAGVVVMIFLLADRFWGRKVAWGAALIGMFNPVGVFMDAIGMIEPVGIFLLLLAIYFWPKKPFLVGTILGLAIFMRAETWVFAVGIFLAMAIFTRSFDKRVALLLPFAGFNLLYMKFLLDRTGNPIYPVYWNFLANAVGKWMYAPTLDEGQTSIRPLFIALSIPSIIGLLWVFLKKIKGKYLYLLGFGNWVFITGMFGYTAYIKSYYGSTLLLTRFFTFPYLFAGLLFSIGVFKIFKGKVTAVIGFLLILAVLGASQIFWQPLFDRYEETKEHWKEPQRIAQGVKVNYEGGKVLIPSHRPDLTYAMVRFQGFDATQFVGEMYDPFFYADYEKPEEHWEDIKEDMFDWFKKEDIRLILVNRLRKEYLGMIESEPEIFEELEGMYGAVEPFSLVRVNHDAFPQ